MRAVVQRSKHSKVMVNNELVGSIDEGIVLLVGFNNDDNNTDIDYLVNKIVNLRIFDDQNGVMNLSIKDINGSILSISQFTLYADTNKGHRPAYQDAMKSDKAIILYEYLNEKLSEHLVVEEGLFGADMKLSIENDGPITIILDSKK